MQVVHPLYSMLYAVNLGLCPVFKDPVRYVTEFWKITLMGTCEIEFSCLVGCL